MSSEQQQLSSAIDSALLSDLATTCDAVDRLTAENAALRAKLAGYEQSQAMRIAWAKDALENTTGTNKMPREPVPYKTEDRGT